MAVDNNIFDTILAQGLRAGQVPARSQQARDWYRSTAEHVGKQPGKRSRDVESGNRRSIVEQTKERLHAKPKIGSMYFFKYDPKWKQELPYYDMFPLIFPFNQKSDRFWGINMHYLPLPLRAKLMDSLYTISNNKQYDESTKLKISYNVLKSASKFRYFRPCIKEYLFTHMKSMFMYIYPAEWDTALFLPVEQFKKQRRQTVWRDSRHMIEAREKMNTTKPSVIRPV